MLNADFLFQYLLKTNPSSSPNALLFFNPEDKKWSLRTSKNASSSSFSSFCCKKTLKIICRPLKIGVFLTLAYSLLPGQMLLLPLKLCLRKLLNFLFCSKMKGVILSLPLPNLRNSPKCDRECGNTPTQSLLIQMVGKWSFSVQFPKIMWLLSESHEQRYPSLCIWTPTIHHGLLQCQGSFAEGISILILGQEELNLQFGFF